MPELSRHSQIPPATRPVDPTPVIVRSGTFGREILSEPVPEPLRVPQDPVATPSSDVSVHTTAKDVSSAASSSQEDACRPGVRYSITRYKKPSDAYGILVNPEIGRSVEKSSTFVAISTRRGKRVKAKDVALSHSGDLVAYLIDSTVHLRQIDLTKEVSTPETPLQLDESKGWMRIAIAGSFLAAWGFGGTKNRLVSAPDLGFNKYPILRSVALFLRPKESKDPLQSSRA